MSVLNFSLRLGLQANRLFLLSGRMAVASRPGKLVAFVMIIWVQGEGYSNHKVVHTMCNTLAWPICLHNGV